MRRCSSLCDKIGAQGAKERVDKVPPVEYPYMRCWLPPALTDVALIAATYMCWLPPALPGVALIAATYLHKGDAP